MKNIIFSFLISIFFSFQLSAQEYVTGTSVNGQIKLFLENNPEYYTSRDKSSKESLELPFWDDFSYSSIDPNPLIWANYDVYINNTLATDPPSYGIATFDAANVRGEIYDHAEYETPFIADSLTSHPINLNYSAEDNIYLSFFYKAQGIVDAPEETDSLILEFYASEDNEWEMVWFAEGETDPGQFEFVILKIEDEKFLKDGFKFRFKNYASLGSSTYPSLAVNCDFWHIDYVYLNKNRSENDIIFHDIALNKPLTSLLEDYEAIPWTHYKENPTAQLNNEISIQYKNNDNIVRLIDSINFKLKDLSGNSTIQKAEGGTRTVQPAVQESFTYVNNPFSFPLNDEEFCDFELNVKIVTDSYDSAQNNSISYTQKFRDYYAYDDGSAEAGYGIYGNGTKFGTVAYLFDPLAEDEIIGVYMYFTHAFLEASQDYFWIYLWEKNEFGEPGDTIRTFEGFKPEYEYELNKFHFYEFDEPISIDRPFFIGWMQTTEDKLNIGFDYNTVNNDKLYYNTSGDWVQSSIEGSVMIRPAFGTFYSAINVKEDQSLKIYPNPVNDKLFIDLPYSLNSNKITVNIFDIQGRLIQNGSLNNNNYINTDKLKKGIYIIKIINDKNQTFHSKFIKQ